MDIGSLLNSRLILVTGKGGTGKSTLASAIGSLSAAHGKKTIVAEIDTFQTTLDRTLGVVPKFKPTRVKENLDCSNITWRESLNEWLRSTIVAERIVRMIVKNKVVQLFLDATPGVRETVILSRIYSLTQEYDQVVVDMPASGHALSILRVPHIAISLLGGGPIRERSQDIIKLLSDEKTSMCIVCLPEEMVINETIELWEKLAHQNPELKTPFVVLNRSARPTVTEDEADLLARLSASENQDSATQELLLAGRMESRLESSTALSIERLEQSVQARTLSIPRLGAHGGMESGSIQIVQQMQTVMERLRVKVQR